MQTSRELKVLVLRASNFYGGPERQIYHHARLAGGSGFDITVASFRDGAEPPQFLDFMAERGIKTHTFNNRGAYDFNSVKLVREYMRDKDIDILCTHDYRSNIIGLCATFNSPTRWMAFSRGWTRENLRIFFYHMLDTFLLRFADRIIAVSESQKKKIQRFLIRPEKIRVVCNAVDTRELDGIEAIDLRRKYSLPDNSIIVASAGRFSHEKGQVFLVQAALDLVRRNDHLYFVLFGDGPDREKLAERVKSTGLDSRIILPGFTPEIIRHLKGGVDIVVNPSLSEAMPNIILEALALQLPVIATGVGGVPEIIENGVSGCLVPSGDAAALSQAIGELALDSKRRDDYAAYGKLRIEKFFTFHKQFDELTGIYAELC